MHMLRQLFDLAGGGSETDAFKHLSATLTVLRSLCSAATVTNTESSRVVRSQTLVIHMYRSKSDTVKHSYSKQAYNEFLLTEKSVSLTLL